jgi:parvulin-like peptidyl-prolyl isomerase
LSRLQEDGADFADLARQHSTDPRTRDNGGSLGIVSRAEMPPAVAAAVFSATSGAVVGPLKTNAGHVLIKVEEILRGQLDAPTAAALQQSLFRNWVAQQVQNGQVQVKLEV